MGESRLSALNFRFSYLWKLKKEVKLEFALHGVLTALWATAAGALGQYISNCPPRASLKSPTKKSALWSVFLSVWPRPKPGPSDM